MESKQQFSMDRSGIQKVTRKSKQNLVDQIVPKKSFEMIQQPKKSTRNKQKLKPMLNDDTSHELNISKRNQKVSVNHLLNFSFPERQSAITFKKTSNQPTFNKERFVNANFRFVMKPGYDDIEHSTNPDMLVKWESVCQMIVPTSKPITCPICLSPPVAARVTKCGHVFCWPCLQHYISLSEHSWRKCPICYESIYATALKRVKVIDTISYEKASPGNPIEMEFTLMKRNSMSAVALPLTSHRKWNTAIPLVDLPNAITFSKVVVANDQYLAELVEKDSCELQELAKSTTEDDYEKTFIDVCLELISIEKELVKEITVKPKFQRESGTETYHFYQTIDGQHYYLHPLDIKILKHEFGSYDAMPTHLKLPVMSIRESTVTQVTIFDLGSTKTL
jgi:hypothetical protein